MNNNGQKELFTSINNKVERFKIEIVKRDKAKEEITLKLNRGIRKVEFKLFQKVEIRMSQGNDIYTFFSTIIGFKEDMLVIKEPEKINKTQRRMSKRYKYTSDIEILKSPHSVFAQSFNLSKGGIGFRCKELFFQEQILFIKLRCPIQRKIYRLEVVVKDQFVEEDGFIRYGVQFAEWVENEFDYLLRFLHNREENKRIRQEKKRLAAEKILEKQAFTENKVKGIFSKINIFKIV